MGKLKQHRCSEEEWTSLRAVLVKTSYNAMVVINYVINKHILVESLISYYEQREFLTYCFPHYVAFNILDEIH